MKSPGMLEPSLGCRQRAQGCAGAATATLAGRGNGADPGSEEEHFFFPDGLEKGEKRYLCFQ